MTLADCLAYDMVADRDQVEVRVCPYMGGAKSAIQLGEGGPVYVSPAMYDLLKGCADELEFARLVTRIPVTQVPAGSVLEVATYN